MNISKNLIVLVFSLLIIPFTVMGQQIADDQVIGEWVFDFETSLEQMDEPAKKHYENMQANNLANIQQAYQNRRFYFGPGGAFLQELANGAQAEGFWIIGRNNKIEITGNNGKVIGFKIVELNDLDLVFIPVKSDEGAANMLFTKWYLKKVN